MAVKSSCTHHLRTAQNPDCTSTGYSGRWHWRGRQGVCRHPFHHAQTRKTFRLIALHIAIGRGNKRDTCPLILLISQIAGPAVATQGGVFWHSNFGAFIPVPPLARIAAPAIAGNIGMRWHTDRFTAVLYALIAGTAIPVITPDDMAG